MHTLRLRVLFAYLLALVLPVSAAAQATHISTSGTLPASCRVGDVYYKTGASAGLYNCTATDTWTLVASGTVGNAFFAVSGPASTTKTFTFPNANATVLTDNAVVTVSQGGTGAAPASDDQVLISDSSSAGTWRTINDCVGSNKALTYTQSTNAIGCATIAGGGGGGVGDVTHTGSLTSGVFVIGNGSADLKASTSEVLPGANGGGMVLLEQHTASSSAALTFTTCISSTYDEYEIDFKAIQPATNAVSLVMQLSTDGGSTWVTSSTYDYSIQTVNNSGVNSGTGSGAGQTSWLIEGLLSNNSQFNLSGWFRVFSPLDSSLSTEMVGHSGALHSDSNRYSWTSFYATNSAVAHNAFKVFMSSGDIAAGTVRCYGIAK